MSGTPCHACPYGEQRQPFSIWCTAGEGKMGDVYWAGMLIRYGCKQNPRETDKENRP